MEKWDYCALIAEIRGVDQTEPAQEAIAVTGVTVQRFSTARTNVTEFRRNAMLGQVIAELGESGWQMVGVAAHDNRQILYFKRRKQ